MTEPEPGLDGEAAEQPATESTESILEALLVEDAELRWDPRSGQPHVTRRQKQDLDSPPGSP